jgi:hypothetical protein
MGLWPRARHPSVFPAMRPRWLGVLFPAGASAPPRGSSRQRVGDRCTPVHRSGVGDPREFGCHRLVWTRPGGAGPDGTGFDRRLVDSGEFDGHRLGWGGPDGLELDGPRVLVGECGAAVVRVTPSTVTVPTTLTTRARSANRLVAADGASGSTCTSCSSRSRNRARLVGSTTSSGQAATRPAPGKRRTASARGCPGPATSGDRRRPRQATPRSPRRRVQEAECGGDGRQNIVRVGDVGQFDGHDAAGGSGRGPGPRPRGRASSCRLHPARSA